MRTQGEYSVCQWFVSGEYEYVRRYVSAEEAMSAFEHYTSSVAVKMGFVTKVIITDGGDCVNMEWIYGKGITFPEPIQEEEQEEEEENFKGRKDRELDSDYQDD